MARAAATAWAPDRPVRLIVPNPAGGGSDQVARLVSDRLATRLGQPIVVDNRGGANGMIAARVAGLSPPDGHTVFLGTVETLAVNPHIYSQITFNPDGFLPVAAINTVPMVFALSRGGRARTIQDLVRIAANGQGNYGHWGVGSFGHIAGELFKEQAKTPKLEGIPYQGAAQCLQGLLGGQIDVMCMPLALARAQGTRVEIVGLASSARLPYAPDIKTMAEAGYPVELEAWFGIFAPPKTPDNVVDALREAINATIAEPQLVKRMYEMGLKPQSFPTVEAYRAWIDGERTRWSGVIRHMGIKPQ